jgi:lipid-binding SYLF domain-containing protein
MSTPLLREQARVRAQQANSSQPRRYDNNNNDNAALFDWESNGGAVANFIDDDHDDHDDDDDMNSAFGSLRRRARRNDNAAVHHQSSSSLFYSNIPQHHQHTPEQQQHQQRYPQQQHQHQQNGCYSNNNNYDNDRKYTNCGSVNTTAADDHNEDLAASARRTWRHHGTGVTQALEEKRRQPQQSSIIGAGAGTGTGGSSSSTIMTTTVVSIVAAVERVDVAMQEYTAYVIRVEIEEQEDEDEDQQQPPSSQYGKNDRSATRIARRPSVLRQRHRRREVFTEHRYSEFAKLHQYIVASIQAQPLPSAAHFSFLNEMPHFPKRSPFGRVGNWTPSQMFAPRQHEELIRYRRVQLDAWLVYIVAAAAAAATAGRRRSSSEQVVLNQHCQAAIYDFILQPTPLPCHRSTTTTVATTTRDHANNNNNNYISSPNVHLTRSIGSHGIPSPPPALPLQAFWQWNNPFSFTLGAGIRQACRTVQLMCGLSSSDKSDTSYGGNNNNNNSMLLPSTSRTLQESDQSIPIDLLRAARGLMFMTVVKGGLVISGRFGTGLVIARRDNTSSNSSSSDQQHCCEWSAPCAVGTLGLGWGALAGADVTHFLVVLTTDKAVADLVSGGKTATNSSSNSRRSASSTLSNSVVQLGAELSVAVGPIGRGANSHLQTGDWTLHQAYAYAHSQGLFVGMSIEGSVITVRHDVNAKFYGRSDFATQNSNYARVEILQNMPPPKAAEPLYQVLHQAMQVEIRKGSFRPSQLLWSQAVGGGNNNNSGDSIYNLNSPATQSYHQHDGGSSGSGDSFNYNTTATTTRGGTGNGHIGSRNGNDGENKINRQEQQQAQLSQQHQYLHPHHHEQFLYPKENHQHFYHQQQHENDMNKSRPAGAATTTTTFPSGNGGVRYAHGHS